MCHSIAFHLLFIGDIPLKSCSFTDALRKNVENTSLKPCLNDLNHPSEDKKHKHPILRWSMGNSRAPAGHPSRYYLEFLPVSTQLVTIPTHVLADPAVTAKHHPAASQRKWPQA
jgi:hypothetical protein